MCSTKVAVTGSLVIEPGQAWDGQTLRDKEEHAGEKGSKSTEVQRFLSRWTWGTKTFISPFRVPSTQQVLQALLVHPEGADLLNTAAHVQTPSPETQTPSKLLSGDSVTQFEWVVCPNTTVPSSLRIFSDFAECKVLQEHINHVRAETPVLNLMF